MQKPYLEMGEIVTTHGVMGECKVYPWCDSAEVFKRIKLLYWDAEGRRSVRVLGTKQVKGMAVLKLEGIETVEEARRLVGRVLYADRRDIPLAKGSHFVQDLLNCTVLDADTGRVYGTVAGITHPANCDVYEIRTPGGGTVLFPAVPEFLGTVDVVSEKITIRPIKGMFDAAEEVREDPQQQQ